MAQTSAMKKPSSALKLPAAPNTWQTRHIAIDPTVDWHMLRMKLDGTETNIWLMALLELKPGMGAQAIRDCQLPNGQFPLDWRNRRRWKKNIRVNWLHQGKNNGFITVRITPRFLKLLQDQNLACAALLSGLMLCRDADMLPVPDGQISGIRAQDKLPAGSVLHGVIDDLLPLAHLRFRSNSEDTGFALSRWSYLWFQGGFNVHVIPNDTYGTFLNQNTVDAILKKSGGDEALAIAAFQNKTGYSLSRLMGRAAHGFHVADLQAGFEPNDAAGKARPLIGVQLPRAMVNDASGLSLAAYVFDAIFFILKKAQDVFDKQVKDKARLPIVITLSYGITQGPHDNSSMLERALAHLIDGYNAQNPTAKACLVLPAGNALEQRGHAVLPPVRATDTDNLEWRVLPDDTTSSFIELWWSTGSSNESLTVTLPDQSRTLVVSRTAPIAELFQGKLCILRMQLFPADAALGRARTQALIALAPTGASYARNEPMGAPHGRWSIHVGGASTAVPVHAWILRDDTPFGTKRGGRQSHFEDTDYRRREAHDLNLAIDTPASTIQRGGAFNGIATGTCDNIVVIGATIASTQSTAGYSGSGYPLTGQTISIRGPDIVTTSEDSALRSGVLASGLRSGAFVALNGTSVAAAQTSRELASALSVLNRIPTSAKHIVKSMVLPPNKLPVYSPSMGEGVAMITADARLDALHNLRRR